MTKKKSNFLQEAARNDRIESTARALREGKVVRVGDSDYLMQPKELKSFEQELAQDGLRIAPTAKCDLRMYLPDGKSEIGLCRIANAAASGEQSAPVKTTKPVVNAGTRQMKLEQA